MKNVQIQSIFYFYYFIIFVAKKHHHHHHNNWYALAGQLAQLAHVHVPVAATIAAPIAVAARLAAPEPVAAARSLPAAGGPVRLLLLAGPRGEREPGQQGVLGEEVPWPDCGQKLRRGLAPTFCLRFYKKNYQNLGLKKSQIWIFKSWNSAEVCRVFTLKVLSQKNNLTKSHFWKQKIKVFLWKNHRFEFVLYK